LFQERLKSFNFSSILSVKMDNIRGLKDPCKYAIAYAKAIDAAIRHQMKEIKEAGSSGNPDSEAKKYILERKKHIWDELLKQRLKLFINLDGACANIRTPPNDKGLNCDGCYVTKGYLEILKEYTEMYKL